MERALADLKPPTRWVGSRIDVHDCVDSTNRIAEEMARAGAPEGVLVVSDQQTAGRGRLGRSFFSPPGSSLYLSLILRPRCPPERLHEHILAAAVAVAECAAHWLPAGIPVEIKWPNDVLLAGRKTSGINLPAQVDASGVAWAVLGIGVNVNTLGPDFPPELRRLATSFRIAGGQPLDRVAVGEDLLERLEEELERLRAHGFDRVLERWRNYFRMTGTRVRVGGPGLPREIEGTVVGVGAEGALLLDTERGPERILAGDVTVLAPRREREA